MTEENKIKRGPGRPKKDPNAPTDYRQINWVTKGPNGKLLKLSSTKEIRLLSIKEVEEKFSKLSEKELADLELDEDFAGPFFDCKTGQPSAPSKRTNLSKITIVDCPLNGKTAKATILSKNWKNVDIFYSKDTKICWVNYESAEPILATEKKRYPPKGLFPIESSLLSDIVEQKDSDDNEEDLESNDSDNNDLELEDDNSD